MWQKVYIYQWRIRLERYLYLGIIPPTIGSYSSNKPEKEQKTKLTPKKSGKEKIKLTNNGTGAVISI